MENIKSCCGAARQQLSAVKKTIPVNTGGIQQSNETHVDADHFVMIPEGSFIMGTDDKDGFPNDGEGPARQVTVSAFAISKYPVTNAQFAQFVEATCYVTEAEQFGWSYVFSDFVSEPNKQHSLGNPEGLHWWTAVNGAFWACPEGPGTSWEDRGEHPAVHISWNDAVAYCNWAGGRLPTEAEWEYAARGGLQSRRYPWGDELHPNKKHMCNIWQGKFPLKNHGSDGYIGTAPVYAFQPNGFGLYQMSGNVWEWCHDYFDPRYHQLTSNVNPIWSQPTKNRSMRGGSYLCHRDYCNRYRVAARNSNSPDSSSGHCGFRMVLTVNQDNQ